MLAFVVCFAFNVQNYTCGRVIIEGNVATCDWVILAHLGPQIKAGRTVRLQELAAAQARLCASGLFAAEPAPTVEVLPNELDATFVDVRIRIVEKPGSRFGMDVCELIIAHLASDPERRFDAWWRFGLDLTAPLRR